MTLASPPPPPLVLMYHGLDPDDGRCRDLPPEEAAYTVRRANFLEHLEAIASTGRRVVDPAALDAQGTEPFLAPGDVLLTFDDGYRSDVDAALPLLCKRDWRALFFLSTDLVGREGRADWGQWREMVDAGMTLGSGENYSTFVKVYNILGEDIENLDDVFTLLEGEPVVQIGLNYTTPF